LLLRLSLQSRDGLHQPCVGRQSDRVPDFFGLAPGVERGDGKPTVGAEFRLRIPTMP
jgi:hypothetical protein